MTKKHGESVWKRYAMLKLAVCTINGITAWKQPKIVVKSVLFIVFAATGGGKNTYFLDICCACKMVEKYYGCKSREKLPVLQPESWDNHGKCPPGAK